MADGRERFIMQLANVISNIISQYNLWTGQNCNGIDLQTPCQTLCIQRFNINNPILWTATAISSFNTFSEILFLFNFIFSFHTCNIKQTKVNGCELNIHCKGYFFLLCRLLTSSHNLFFHFPFQSLSFALSHSFGVWHCSSIFTPSTSMFCPISNDCNFR